MRNDIIKIHGNPTVVLEMDFWDYPMDESCCPRCGSNAWNSIERSCYECHYGAFTIHLVNCTPHMITYRGESGSILIPPSGIVPRCEVSEKRGDKYVPFRLVNKVFGKVENLPEPQENIYYIVSSLVAQAAKRDDLLVPNTVRDEFGQVIGCDSFAQIM